MTREQILKKRWSNTDKLLREFNFKYQKLSNQLKNNLQMTFDSLNLNSGNIFQYATSEQKRKIDIMIEEWQDDGLLNGYFRYLANSIHNRKRIKNSEILYLLICKCYLKQRVKLDEYESDLFKQIANTEYQEAQREIYELNKKKDKPINISKHLLLSLFALPNSKGYVWSDYIQATILNNTEQIHRQAIIDFQQNHKITVDRYIYESILNFQRKRYLNINRNKISGDLDVQVTSLTNNSLIEGYKEVDKNAKVRFIAEMDQRTTKMCKSLDNQIFSVNDWNTFQRYSHDDGRVVNYKVFGLVAGVNLPPINNHFHWCRSTVTYQTDMPRDMLNKKLMTWNEKNALQQYLGGKSIIFNEKMRNKQKLTMNEKRYRKNLYRALNKMSNYEGNIVRVVSLENEMLDKFLNEYSEGKIVEFRQFTSFSNKKGYNKKANVEIWVANSKKGKNMIEYSLENEIIYPYNTKMLVKKVHTENDKHYILLEEQ